MTAMSLTMGLSHLLVVDAGPGPIQQCHWEGHHVPRSEDLGDVGLHVLIGQKAISAVMGGMGSELGCSADTHQIHLDGTFGISGNGGALQEG